MVCKFKCVGMNLSGDKFVSVSFSPIKDGVFGENTPAGSVNLVLIPEASNQFQVGKVYNLDFKECVQETCSTVK